jgi:HSP20 family protein
MNNECMKNNAGCVQKGAQPQKVNRREITPASYAEETKDAFILNIELPGVAQQAIDLSVENRTLSVTAENSVNRYPDRELVLNEIGEIRYRASFDLPERVDGGNIKATLKNGVLSLTLPKHAEVQQHKIAIAAE